MKAQDGHRTDGEGAVPGFPSNAMNFDVNLVSPAGIEPATY